MPDIYRIAAAAFSRGAQQIDAISSNAANATTVGYRRRMALSTPFEAHLAKTEGPARLETGSPGPAATGMLGVDKRPGQLVATGRALDVALEAPDLWFAVTDGTQIWMTRAGSLRLDDRGVLIGERGLRVVGTNGDIQLPAADFEVTRDGHFVHEGAVVGALQLFRIDDASALRPATGSLMDGSVGVHAIDGESARVRSGFLENSNVSSTDEMLGLMTLTRQFESLVRLTQNYDELVGRTIQKLGEV